jgi:hypothetical protein
MQTRVGQLNGNCFEACIASLLEIPLHSVPDFPRDEAPFILAVQQFLREYGLFYIQTPIDDLAIAPAFASGFTWHTMEGISERGGNHACVGLNGKLVHDPHPGGRGLVEINCFGFLVSRMGGALCR